MNIFQDVVHEPLDWKLVEQTNMSLQQASDNLVQLYKRISLDHSLQENMRIQFLQKLVITADIAQQTLRPINPGSQSIVPNNMIKVKRSAFKYIGWEILNICSSTNVPTIMFICIGKYRFPYLVIWSYNKWKQYELNRKSPTAILQS